jgi:hypothetical protein
MNNMKALKYIISALVIFTLVWSCMDDDEFGSTDFVATATAPSNLTALYDVTTDNTGLVTITPNGEGANFFDVAFGDSSGESASLKPGESVTHVYAEGSYEVKLTGYGITGLETEQSIPLTVSFKAPENLEVIITNDAAISKKVNVIATADFAMVFDVYFGEEGNDEPVTANIGEIASYVYQEAGTYSIRVVAKSAAMETTESTQEFEAVAIVQPIQSAPAPPARAESDVISIFTDKYANVPGTDFFPDWGQAGNGSGWAMFELDGDEMLNYTTLSYQGIQIGETQSLTDMEYLHMDIWTADLAQIRTFLINEGVDPPENVLSDLTVDQWTSIDIPMSAFTDQGVAIDKVHQFKFVSEPYLGGSVFIDNIYFWKEPSSSGPSVIEGTWRVASEAGSIKVGPSPGSGDWWSIDDASVVARACYFDDTYVFNQDGSFKNILGSETWIEPWQGSDPEACGAPVAPHDGSADATFSHNETAGTITINGLGAYIGLPKVNNAGELPNVSVPATIEYTTVLSDNDNTMTISIEQGSGTFWTYKLVRDGAVIPSPIEGTWVMASEAGSMKVGPSQGSDEWWAIDDAGVEARACYYDDTYNLSSGGSFSNNLGADTWVEGWQGGSDACGAAVAPHDGSAMASFLYNETAGTLTITGAGAYLGVPKVNNDGELPNVPLPDAITYDVTLSDNNNTMTASVEAGSGTFWTFKLVKEGSSTPPPSVSTPYNPIDFETGGYGADWTWTVFENDSNPAVEIIANPDASGINTSATVAKITALTTGQPWVGCESLHGSDIGSFSFDASNSTVKIMVWKSVISDVGLKFAEANGDAQPEVKVANTLINQWEELTFDLSGSIGVGATGVIDQIIVFPDFNVDGRATDNVVYFDNITFGSN